MVNRRTILGGMAAGLAMPYVARPALAKEVKLDPAFQPRVVRVKPGYAEGSIHVLTQNHFLYLMLGGGKAMRYGVAVGAEGRNLSGSTTISRKVEWPSWTPTKNMIAREPEKYRKFAGGMAGGPDNPLGARALYLYRGGRDTRYRIHGTPQPWTIGRSVSSGCIRMVNDHVIDLYARVPVGTRVTIY